MGSTQVFEKMTIQRDDTIHQRLSAIKVELKFEWPHIFWLKIYLPEIILQAKFCDLVFKFVDCIHIILLTWPQQSLALLVVC